MMRHHQVYKFVRFGVAQHPSSGVKGTYGFGDIFIQHYGIDSIWNFANDPHADRQIKDVYMARSPEVFTPTISLKEWWREIRG
jgi:hypothetical protein